ncbi:hypothetical protein ACFS4T_15990 [Pseudomonas lini]
MIEADEPVTFVQTQEAVELILVSGRAEFAQQGVFEVLIVFQNLKALGGGVKKGIGRGVADHQRARQLYIVGLVFPQTHGFKSECRRRAGCWLNQGVQGLALFRADDLGFALEQELCARLFPGWPG